MDPGDWVNLVSGDEKRVKSGESSGFRDSDLGTCDGSRDDFRFSIVGRLLRLTSCLSESASESTLELPRKRYERGKPALGRLPVGERVEEKGHVSRRRTLSAHSLIRSSGITESTFAMMPRIQAPLRPLNSYS
jgi:hypothetical protein